MPKGSVMLAVLALVGLLAACGGSDDEASPTPTTGSGGQEPTATATEEPEETWNIRWISAWDINNGSVTGAMDIILPEVTNATGGRVTFERVGGPETVPTFEQLQPVQQGVFDMVLQTDGYNQVNSLAAALNLSRAPYHYAEECGLLEAIDQNYQERGQVKYYPQNHTFGNIVLLKDGPNLAPDLSNFEGLNIRTYPTVNGFIEAMGGNPTALDGADAYTALERGVVDGGIGGSRDFAYGLSWHEVTDFAVQPDIGATVATFLINLNVWTSFPEDVKEGWDEGMRIGHEKYQPVARQTQDEVLVEMLEHPGFEVRELSDEVHQQWIDTWFEATSEAQVLARDAERGPVMIERAECVKDRVAAEPPDFS